MDGLKSTVMNQPIVVDNGSGVIKAGFAGQDYPSSYFPSLVGRPKHTKIMAGAVEGDHFIGKRAQELRGLLSLSHPMTHGSAHLMQESLRIGVIWSVFGTSSTRRS